LLFFFFQAEDGIRDLIVTGVQTCALPIYRRMISCATSICRATSGFIALTRKVPSAASVAVSTSPSSAWRKASASFGKTTPTELRSEERRVGKECRSGGGAEC